MKNFKKIIQDKFLLFSFLSLVTVTFHLMFSSLGFIPTDDGYVLAYSRRLIEGQLPHRDFITIRPILSGLIHLPFVYWGGEYTFWISRLFVWFQLATIAWIWTYIAQKMITVDLGKVEKILISLISLMISTHTFPIMAWHTIDGLLLITIGTSLCINHQIKTKLIGYFIIGLACLCKQNFFFVAPLTIIILSDWSKPKCWLAFLFPGIFYLVYLLISGSFYDAFVQLTSQNKIWTAAFKIYLNKGTFFGLLVGYFTMFFSRTDFITEFPFKVEIQRWAPFHLFFTIPFLSFTLMFYRASFFSLLFFILFGLLIGYIIFIIFNKNEETPSKIRLCLLALSVSWATSISIGYNYPALTSGQTLAILYVCTSQPIHLGLKKKYSELIMLGLTCLMFFSFRVARTNRIYYEQNATNLKMPLNEVMHGGKNIFINNNTYAFLRDLKNAISVAKTFGKTFSIIPQCAGVWVQSEQQNPLPIDWVQPFELNTDQLINQISNRLISVRKVNVILIQKADAKFLAVGFIELDNQYKVIDFVRNNFSKVSETKFFDIYI